MSLSFFTAVDDIRDAAIEHRLPGPRKKLLWATILAQVAKRDAWDELELDRRLGSQQLDRALGHRSRPGDRIDSCPVLDRPGDDGGDDRAVYLLETGTGHIAVVQGDHVRPPEPS